MSKYRKKPVVVEPCMICKYCDNGSKECDFDINNTFPVDEESEKCPIGEFIKSDIR